MEPEAKSGDTSGPLPRQIRNDVIIVALALTSVGLLLFDLAMDLEPADARLLGTIDIVIAIIFLIEWSFRFIRAERKGMFFRQYWWELLASLPLTAETAQALRGLRLLRAVRLIRLLRVVRLGMRLNILYRHIRNVNDQTHLFGLTVFVAMVILTSALAFYVFEQNVNPAVQSVWDSFWWAFITVTTVGYGDIYPVTTGGRATAVFLLLVGLGSFGVYTASIANYVLSGKEPRDEGL